MVQRVTVSPSEVRGYGDIVSPKNLEDFTGYMSSLSESDGVYTMVSDDTTSYLRLSVSPGYAEYGDSVDFIASLMIEGELVEGATISFYEGETLIGTGVTGSDGGVILTKTDLSIATHNVYAVYEELESQTVTVTVSKISVQLSLSTNKSTVVSGESFTLSGVLSLGSGKTVKLYDDGTFVKNITTGTDGAFSETVSGASAGSHSYYVAYLGDETTKSVTSSPVTVTVTQITPTISLATDKSTVGTGDSFTLSGVLSVVGSGVDVKLYNGETLVDTLQTGTGGAFSKTITATVAGINTYRAVFEGTAEYSSVTSNNVEVTVKIMPTLTLSTSSASVTAGGSYTLSGALTYNGEGIQTNDLILRVNGRVATYLSTGSDGTFSKTYSNAVIGTYSYKVVFNETTTYAAVESSNVSVVVSNSQPASISLTGTKNILSYADSESSVLTATVLDDNDDPVEGATVELYKDNVLWDTLTTGSAGTVSKTYTSLSAGDVSFKAECGSLVTETYVIHDYLWVPKLDGTETIHQVQGTTTIANGEMSGGSGYIGAFDNTGNWEITLQAKWSNTQCGIWLIKPTETNRDSNDVLILNSNVYRHANGSGEGGTIYMPSCNTNTYTTLKLTKNGNQLTIQKCNDSKTETWSLLTTLSSLAIGVDAWGGTATIKDIVVKPL